MPSLLPNQESPLYFVRCNYGPKIGKSYYEADPESPGREIVVEWLLRGQYTRPERVIEVDVSAGHLACSG